MFEKADEDHDAGAVPGIKYLFFQESVLSALPAT
jgi:hypothetical protein